MEAYYVMDMHTAPGAKQAVPVFRFPTPDAAIAYGEGFKSKRIAPLCGENAFWQSKRAKETDSMAQHDPEWAEGLTDAAAYTAILQPTAAKVSAMDGASAVAAFEAPMAPQPRRRLVKRLDDGDAIDAERYAVEHTVERVWQRRFRSAKPVPTLRVAINAAASCMTESTAMARAAAAVLSLIRVAEDNGYAVEVDWCCGLRSPKGNQFVALVPLKRVDEHLDWSRLVGFTVGGSTFRTLGFDLAAGLAKDPMGHGLGYPHHVEASVFGHDVASPSHFNTDAEAQRWAADAAKALAAKAAV